MDKVLNMGTMNGPFVYIDGHPFQTLIGGDGVQRFPANRIVRALLDTGKLDLNDIWAMADSGAFSRRELMTFYMDLGYTLDGFADLFSKAEIQNPLWDDGDDEQEGS